MEKLRNLIVFFIRHFPRPLTRTELVKLIYLFEYEHVQIRGSQYSEVVFVRDKFGPFAPAILNTAERLCRDGIANCSRSELDRGCILYEYSLADSNLAARYGLPLEQESYVLALIERVSRLSLPQIKDLAYSTPPMVGLVAREAQFGSPLIRRRMDMSVSKTPKRFTKAELAAAKERLDSSIDRGSNQEYFSDMLRDYKDYEDLRRRATACLLKA